MNRQSDEPVYVISVAAKLAGLKCWMLRQLDNEGLVTPVRTSNNRRLYSDNDVSRLEHIQYLITDVGANVAAVKYILEIESRLNQSVPGDGGSLVDDISIRR
jgi:MerR family transcriptional regulator, heat shock protein HspR